MSFMARVFFFTYAIRFTGHTLIFTFIAEVLIKYINSSVIKFLLWFFLQIFIPVYRRKMKVVVAVKLNYH